MEENKNTKSELQEKINRGKIITEKQKQYSHQITQLLKEIKDTNKNVLIYSLNGCPSCKELKDKFSRIGLEHKVVEMDGNETMWAELAEKGGSDFAPQVEVDGYLIKEKEYTNINELISVSLSNVLNRKIIIK